MPKVVPDQRAKFEGDELFRKLGRESEVRCIFGKNFSFARINDPAAGESRKLGY